MYQKQSSPSWYFPASPLWGGGSHCLRSILRTPLAGAACPLQGPAELSWKNTLASESCDAKLYSWGNLSPALDATRRNSPSLFLREERSSLVSPSREIPPLSAPWTTQHLHSPLITFLFPNHISFPFVLHVTRSPHGLWATLSANGNNLFALRHLRDISC